MNEAAAIDTSPLIILSRGGWLSLPRLAADRIVVPRTVAQEVRRYILPDAATGALLSEAWLEIVDTGVPPARLQRYRLGEGETAVLTWTLANPGSIAVIDELRGRRAAVELGIPVTGILGLILDAKRNGTIPAARPVVEHLLRHTDQYLSRALLDRVLARVDE